MNPLNATLTGALGIQAGLGRDSITLDLTGIPEDALTVAIRGDNGMGKSTLLNLALVPWREPPQLAGSVYDQFGPVGLRELTWSHAGKVYQSRIEIRQKGKTKSQKATLSVQHDGKWTPVRLPDNTVSDGKSSTYDACLTHILGHQDLYYLSAFRAQNAPKLAEHDDPKGLMRALLALDEPAALSEQARDIARDLKRHHAAIRAQADALDGHPRRIAELEAAASAIEAAAPQREQAKLDAVNAAAVAKAELERAVSGDLDRQRLLAQRTAIEKRLADTKSAVAANVSAAEVALTAAQQRAADAERAADARIAAAAKDVESATARAERAQQALRERDAIEAAEAEAARLAEQLARDEASIETRRAEIEQLRALAAQVQTLQAKQANARDNGKRGKVQLDALIARAGFVEQVPCRGEGEYAGCPALAEAKAAAGQIADAQAAVDALRQEWLALDAQIKALEQQSAKLPEMAAAQSQANAVLANLRLKLDAVRATAAKRNTLKMAEQQRTEALAAVEEMTARLAQLRAEKDATLTAAQDEINDATRRLDGARNDGARSIDAITAELAAVPEPDADSAVTLARQQLGAAEDAVTRAQDAINQAGADIAQQRAEQARLRKDMDDGKAIIERVRHLEAEIADWTLLGLGLRGVIDLSIEDAGPGIAALANRLLTEAYGPRFSVRIVTQREQTNGVTKETFDISVIDADSGIESSLLRKSGGEMVWIDKALTDAVGLYHQDSAGQHYECLFADEAEDGLTQERKAQFYRMDRAALALGGYQRKYFISHNPDAWAQADHVINLADYKEGER